MVVLTITACHGPQLGTTLVVIRETGAALAGRAPSAVRPELLEDATWRAAQSGLEGNLVDVATATPVPAHQLIRQLLAELRPALYAASDWELAAGDWELAAGLARGSSATRQRGAQGIRSHNDQHVAAGGRGGEASSPAAAPADYTE